MPGIGLILSCKKKNLLETPKKKSNEGAQVKKGLKTPYCRVGERPGLGVLLYHPKAPTLFLFITQKKQFYNIRKTSSFHLNHACLFLLRTCLLDIITFCAVTLGEYRSTLRYKLLDLHLNKPMISPWNKNTPYPKFIDLETAQMSSLIQFASWKQQNFHVTACLLRFKSVLPLRNKGLTRNYIL